MTGAPPPAMPEPPAAEPGVGANTQFLTFTLADEPFAIEIGAVLEILQHGPMTFVPRMPDFVRGVLNLRGAVVPVIDLQARFGRAQACAGLKRCIVIVGAVSDGERSQLGLLVDAVNEVVDLGADLLEPSPAFGSAIRREYIRGIASLAGRIVTVLDPGRAFDLQDMARLCEAAHRAVHA